MAGVSSYVASGCWLDSQNNLFFQVPRQAASLVVLFSSIDDDSSSFRPLASLWLHQQRLLQVSTTTTTTTVPVFYSSRTYYGVPGFDSSFLSMMMTTPSRRSK
jgi:hypothetical protein